MTAQNINKNQIKKNESGQTLVLIVFVMIMALTLGISTSSRFITNLRSTTDTQIAYRSTAVAEAAMDRILLKTYQELLDHVNNGDCGADCVLSITNDDGVVETANVTLTQLGGSSDPYLMSLKQSTPREINVTGYPNSTDVSICWDDPSVGDPPSIVGFLVSGSVGSYSAEAFAYNSASSVESNGFDVAVASGGFSNCFNVDSSTSPQLIRVRALYNDVDIVIAPTGGNNLPSQGILIESTGTSLDSTNVVTAIKGVNTVPAPFDFALYSQSEVSPLSN